jgi:O-antigen biosynthesis protein
MTTTSEHSSKSVRSCRVHWWKVIRDMVSHTGGLRRRTWRLAREYWTIHRSGSFDRSSYLADNSDVAAAGVDPLWHYLCHGEKEGRRPSRQLSYEELFDLTNDSSLLRGSRLAKLIREGPVVRTAVDTAPAKASHTLPRIGRLGEVAARPKRIAVYTAIFDGYDELQQPEVVSNDADYICFSDMPIKSPGVWQVRALDYFHTNPRRTARFAKVHPHIYFPDHEWSLWIDGRVRLRIDPMDLVRQSSGDLTAFWHPERVSPFQEAEEVIALGLDNPDIVNRQMSRQRDVGFPADAPLHETNVLLRRHMSEQVVAHSRIWFAEIQSGSLRDQLSFDFAGWRAGVPIESFGVRPLNVRNDPRFFVASHLRRKRNATVRMHSGGDVSGTFPVLNVGKPASSPTETASVDIIVCVHNALEDVTRCLEAVVRSRTKSQRLILVDDGSDPETRDWLTAHLASLRDDDVLIRRETAGGYTVAANHGLRASTAPFVALLNSDTIVPSGWIKKLIAALDSGPDIGLAGPLSNAASYQSIPEVVSPEGGFKVNDLPSGTTVEDMDRLCQQLAADIYPRVPILNGFCILMRRSLIDRVGLLDEQAFPRGYGEENDYCFRAWDAGFSAVIACTTYVFHAKSRSYTSLRRNELARAAGMALKQKWSEERVRSAAQTLEEHPWLAAIRSRVAEALAERAGQAGSDA